VSTITYKEYAPKLIPRGRTFKKNIQVLKDFERELGHLKKLSHSHIVELVGSYTDPKFVAIIMSPVAEYNLKDFLALDPLPRGGRSFLRTFFGCLATAVYYLHENRVRHKDIKPQNVLVKGHQVFLTDFGISLDWSELDQSTTSGPAIRTLRYCAPEVADFMPRNLLSDVWSLGCVVLEIWTALKGEKITSLLEYLDRNGSKSTCYFLNRDSAITWCTNLEDKSGTSEDNPPSDWIRGMMQLNQDDRWTTRTISEHIREVNADPENRFAFSGLCCINDDESTDSEPSSTRASTNLERTSSIAAHHQPSTAGDGMSKMADAVTDLTFSQTVRPSRSSPSQPQPLGNALTNNRLEELASDQILAPASETKHLPSTTPAEISRIAETEQKRLALYSVSPSQRSLMTPVIPNKVKDTPLVPAMVEPEADAQDRMPAMLPVGDRPGWLPDVARSGSALLVVSKSGAAAEKNEGVYSKQTVESGPGHGGSWQAANGAKDERYYWFVKSKNLFS
jgi:serine/threonine protein kinase